MAGVAEERAAFAELVTLLHRAAATNARALPAYRGTPVGDTLEGQLDHTLDRLAVLYGRGTYENLSTVDILDTAVDNELRMAVTLDEPAAGGARARAGSLVDAARRGVGLHVRAPDRPIRLLRGVYVESPRQEFERSLWAREEPYVRWRAGVLVILDEDEVAALRVDGDEVDVLFLDPDELLDLDGGDDIAALDAELQRRLAIARAAADRVGDSPGRYLLRMLHRQSVVLRNLRDRLADGHPGAHAALLPILAEHTTFLTERLATDAVAQDPLGAVIDDEREVWAHASRWAAEPEDPAGMRDRFQAVADAGTRLAELERLHP